MYKYIVMHAVSRRVTRAINIQELDSEIVARRVDNNIIT